MDRREDEWQTFREKGATLLIGGKKSRTEGEKMPPGEEREKRQTIAPVVYQYLLERTRKKSNPLKSREKLRGKEIGRMKVGTSCRSLTFRKGGKKGLGPRE